MSTLVLGTRGSALALAQSRQIAAQLQAAHSGLEIKEKIIRTEGDARQTASLPAIGGKGVFTSEIEAALLAGEIDFAIHSLKDLPPDMPAGLCLAAVPSRADASDILIRKTSIESAKFDDENAILKIGTSSLRRAAMLLNARPNWEILEVRGNIDTRLRKLETQDYDAIVLARAGLQRLGIEEKLRAQLMEVDAALFIPAPGQGALAIQARSDDEGVLTILDALENDAARSEIIAERAVVKKLHAGCSTRVGARATATDGVLSLRACVLSLDGKQRIEASGKSIPERARDLGEIVGQKLLDQGARELLS